jgi:hypothetical protein
MTMNRLEIALKLSVIFIHQLLFIYLFSMGKIVLELQHHAVKAYGEWRHSSMH